LKDGTFSPSASPTLADLDGDGKAEIIVFDSQTSTIRAWRGDGTGVRNADGIIATIPETCEGVSVVDLGGDGVMDFFAGTFWVRMDKAGAVTTTNMLPQPTPTSRMQPTVADVDGDGKAEVIFGLPDGRVFIYRTEM